MSSEATKLAFKAVARIAKYADGVTEEQIENGLVEPLEIVESEDVLFLTPEEAEDMGFDTQN